MARYFDSISTLTLLRPQFIAATAVVPVPQNGSRIVSPEHLLDSPALVVLAREVLDDLPNRLERLVHGRGLRLNRVADFAALRIGNGLHSFA